MQSREALLADLQPWVERARGFSGWDFSDLRRRPIDREPPWDYMARSRELAAGARLVLDLGTGGGERLAEIANRSPARFVATEAWPPNQLAAARNLAAFGIPVVGADAERPLPFRSSSFDLVLSRHEALSPAAAADVLIPGGRVVTQQVGHDNWPEWREMFPGATHVEDHGERYTREFEDLGFYVAISRHRQRVTFPRGEFVYRVAVAPWDLGDFDIARDLEHWGRFFDVNSAGEDVIVTETSYLLEAWRD